MKEDQINIKSNEQNLLWSGMPIQSNRWQLSIIDCHIFYRLDYRLDCPIFCRMDSYR